MDQGPARMVSTRVAKRGPDVFAMVPLTWSSELRRAFHRSEHCQLWATTSAVDRMRGNAVRCTHSRAGDSSGSHVLDNCNVNPCRNPKAIGGHALPLLEMRALSQTPCCALVRFEAPCMASGVSSSARPGRRDPRRRHDRVAKSANHTADFAAAWQAS